MPPSEMFDGTEDDVTEQFGVDVFSDLSGLDRFPHDADQNRGVPSVKLLYRRTLVITLDPHLGNEEPAQVGVRDEHLHMPLDQRFQTATERLMSEDLVLKINQNSLVELPQDAVQKITFVAKVSIDKTV